MLLHALSTCSVVCTQVALRETDMCMRVRTAGMEEDDSSPHPPPLSQLHSNLTSCPTPAPSPKRAPSPEKASQTKPDQPAAGPSKGKGPATPRG
jgi:hypothetical protein